MGHGSALVRRGHPTGVGVAFSRNESASAGCASPTDRQRRCRPSSARRASTARSRWVGDDRSSALRARAHGRRRRLSATTWRPASAPFSPSVRPPAGTTSNFPNRSSSRSTHDGAVPARSAVRGRRRPDARVGPRWPDRSVAGRLPPAHRLLVEPRLGRARRRPAGLHRPRSAYQRALNGAWGRLDVDDTAALIRPPTHRAGLVRRRRW